MDLKRDLKRDLNELHHFWFEEISITDTYYASHVPRWFFGNDPIFDLACKEKFSSWLHNLSLIDSDLKNLSDKEYLGLILLLDQIPRNSFRGSKKSYSFDSIAQKLCLEGLGTSRENSLSYPEKLFFYLPLEHAENLVLQNKSVELFEKMNLEAPLDIQKWTKLALERAYDHRKTIIEFGHFPRRAKN